MTKCKSITIQLLSFYGIKQPANTYTPYLLKITSELVNPPNEKGKTPGHIQPFISLPIDLFHDVHSTGEGLRTGFASRFPPRGSHLMFGVG